MITTPKKPLATWKIGLSSILVAVLFFTFSCQEEVLNDIQAIESTMTQMQPTGVAKSALDELRKKYPDFSFSYFETDAENLDRAEKLQNLDNETIAGIYVDKSGDSGTIGIILSDRAGWKPRQTDSNNQEVFNIVENPAQPKGGMKTLQKYLIENMKYPQEAERAGIEGKVFVQFIVNENGEISDAKVVKGIGSGCDEEALRVVSNQPDWEPPTQRGTAVKQRIVLPVTFKLGHTGTIHQDKSQAKLGMEVDETASPVGGYEVLYAELVENIKYPGTARENKVSGKVFVQFTVSKEGTLSDITPLKGIGYGFDEEAVRVLSESKVKWEPAVKNGQRIAQKIVLPITFAQK